MTPKEKGAQDYREFMLWARALIADSIMRYGFTELEGCIIQILNAHAQLKKNHPS